MGAQNDNSRVTPSQGNNHPPVKVYLGDPPNQVFLFLIPAHEARQRLHRCEAVSISRRKIKVIPRTRDHTLQGQLQGWAEKRAIARPDDLWVSTGLARLDQIEGLPVVGDPITLLYGPAQKPAASPARTAPTPISTSKPEKVDPNLKKAA